MYKCGYWHSFFTNFATFLNYNDYVLRELLEVQFHTSSHCCLEQALHHAPDTGQSHKVQASDHEDHLNDLLLTARTRRLGYYLFPFELTNQTKQNKNLSPM